MKRRLALASALVAVTSTGPLGGCGLRRVLPSGPVVSPNDLPAFEMGSAPPVSYLGPARTTFPVLPLQVFGLHYDVDLVLVTRGTGWDMHEYARVRLEDGSAFWLAKDTDADLVQTITAPMPDLAAWAAEAPVPRRVGPLEVVDRSSGQDVDVDLSYSNPRGQSVQVVARGRMPDRPPRNRNGNTMGHSRQAVAVVLDLARNTHLVRGRVWIDGERVPLRRLLGLVSYRFLLDQTQGGVAVASFTQQAGDAGGFVLTRPGVDPLDPATGMAGWPTERVEHWTSNGEHTRYTDPLVSMDYRFVGGGLARATVRQVAVAAPVFELWLEPALPDLSRPFEGEVQSTFRFDVGGEEGHGRGTLSARWVDDDTVAVELVPTAPAWLADRPMASVIRYLPDDRVSVETRRVD